MYKYFNLIVTFFSFFFRKFLLQIFCYSNLKAHALKLAMGLAAKMCDFDEITVFYLFS